MTTITAQKIKEEQEQLMKLSESGDGKHFSLLINSDCEVSQLGFSEGTQFHSVLIIINTLEHSYVKGNLQSIKICNSSMPTLSKDAKVFLSFKSQDTKLNRLYLQINDFQCKITKKGFHFTEESSLISSIYVYYDHNSVETLLIADAFNAQGYLARSTSNNGTFGSIIKNMLLNNSSLSIEQFKSIAIGNSND